VNEIATHLRINLIWVPGHRNIEGNCIADELDKRQPPMATCKLLLKQRLKPGKLGKRICTVIIWNSQGAQCGLSAGIIYLTNLAWDPSSDNLQVNLTHNLPDGFITNPIILSMITRVYDTLGLIAPVVTKLKIFLKALWKEKLDWDESLPQTVHYEWNLLISQLLSVCLKFPLFVLTPPATIELHGFCDASMAAYGACVYVQSELQIEIQGLTFEKLTIP